ncbi:MAG: hypothetical protein Q7S40_34960 [Opitutaceae bacterium]|nr:hypothetical protein [Opitutaceae bacterium]
MVVRACYFGAVVIAASALAPCAAAVAGAIPGNRAATASEVELLTRALEKTAADMGRWSYTETRLIRDEKGRVKSTVVVRYDPSKPYAEQWAPISINGKSPSSSDRDKYRRQGEREGKRSERGESSRRYSLGELLEVTKAKVARDDGAAFVFDVPLRVENNNRFPPEKFEVLIRVEKKVGAIGNIALRLRESFRSKLILKVKSGDGVLEFAAVDAQHPPTLTAIRGDASASILFVSVGGELDLKRTGFKRVKPYSERFEVKIGTLKSIDFLSKSGCGFPIRQASRQARGLSVEITVGRELVESAQGPEPVEGQPQMGSKVRSNVPAAEPALSLSKGCRSHFGQCTSLPLCSHYSPSSGGVKPRRSTFSAMARGKRKFSR